MALTIMSDFFKKNPQKGENNTLSLFPNRNTPKETEGEQKLMRKLKECYSHIKSGAILYVQPQLEKWDAKYSLRPDFILLDPDRGIIIFEVKDWSNEGIINTFMHSCQIKGVPGRPKNPFFQVSEYREKIIQRLIKRNIEVAHYHEKKGLPLLSYSVFPNMTEKDLKNNFEKTYDGEHITKEKFKKITPETLFKRRTISTSKDYIQNIQVALFPELEVHKPLHLMAYNPSIKMLDLEQEQIARQLPRGHFKLTGVPGSGKTIIVMARAIYLLRQKPNWKIKILTFNTQLKNKLENMLESQSKNIKNDNFDPRNISIKTIHSVAREIAKVDIKDPNLFDRALQNAKPEYNAVLIDEYQDFDTQWIELALKICKKDPRINEENFFLAGDRVQSLYGKKEPTWKKYNINIVGKTKFLRKPYRSKHIEFALKVLAENIESREEIRNNYDDFSEIQRNETKGIHFIKENFSDISKVITDFQKQTKGQFEDMMILVPGRKEAEQLERNLSSSIKKHMNFVASKYGKYKKNYIAQKNKILVETYHSAKGLESKNCIMLNVEKLFTNKHTQKAARNLLFVGITRASENLYIHGKTSSDVFKKMQSFA